MSWPPQHLKLSETPEPVRAPCCGRVTAADAVHDFSGVAGMPDAYLCDACRERERRTRDIERSDIMLGLGAPVREVKLERAKEVLRDRIRARPESAGAYDRNVQMKAALRDVLA